MVITKGNYYAKNGGDINHQGYIQVFNTNNGVNVCANEIGGVSGTTYYGSHLSGLRTSLYDSIDSNSDWDGNGYNDIFVFVQYAYDVNSSLYVYDVSCNSGEIAKITYDRNIIGYPLLTGGGGSDISTGDWFNGVWADYDNDGLYEYLYLGGVYEVDKSSSGGFGSTLAKGIMNESTSLAHTEKQFYAIVGDITNNGLLDIIVQNNKYTPSNKVYSFSFSNSKPTIDTFETNTGNPVCIGETVTFTLGYTDSDSQLSRVGYDCYSNDTYTFTNYQSSPIIFSCEYNNETGTATLSLVLQDSYMNITDYTVNTSYDVILSNSEYCNNAGDGGGSIFSETGSSSGTTDFVEIARNSISSSGFKSTASKLILAIFIIIAIIMIVAKQFQNAFVSIIIGILSAIGLTYLGLIPIWVIFLIFITSIALVVFTIMRSVSGGE